MEPEAVYPAQFKKRVTDKYDLVITTGSPALSEGKFGNIKEARNLFNYITSNYKTNGAVYVEASKFEEREDNIEEAVDYCD
jgi:hypothetical protein